MTKSNAELAAFRGARRNASFAFPPTPHKTWLEAREERSLFRFIVGCLLLAVVCLVMYGMATEMRDDIKHERWAKQAVESCIEDGKTPHVYRDNRDYVLGVRCDP